MAQQESEYISPEEASLILGKSRRTVDRYASEKKLPRYLRDNKLLFKREDVYALRTKQEEVVQRE